MSWPGVWWLNISPVAATATAPSVRHEVFMSACSGEQTYRGGGLAMPVLAQ